MVSIKQLVKRFLGIDIVKVFSLNALSTFIRMLAGMISVKVVALIIGPVGIALLGQLNNISTILLGLANGGISNGITKYVAEYKQDECKIKSYLSNALKITITSSIIVAIFLIAGSLYLSRYILMSDDYYYVFIVFGFTIVFFALNALLTSILNGYKEFRKYVIVNICGTIFGLVYSLCLVLLWGLHGAMINAVTFQSIMFFVTLWMCRNMPWFKKEFFVQQFQRPIVKRYLGYSLMTITMIAMLPVAQMLLRGYVISELSPSEAGIWEGMNRISSMYLGVITSSFSVYYLPRLSEITDPIELHNEIKRCYKLIIPMLLSIIFVIYILRHFVLWLLFSPEFYSMDQLFSWQLAGDFFKICSWLLAFLMVAKAKTKMFISTEILFTLTYVLLSFFFLHLNGIVGLTQGYLLNTILYCLAMGILFKNIILIRYK
jgi:PST family polysaccharide transporter